MSKKAGLSPDEIRKASYNLESYLPEHDFSFRNVKVHDMGNIGTLDEFGNVENVIESVYSTGQYMTVGQP